MWRGKKLLIAALLTAVLLAGCIGGVVLAGSDSTSTKSLFARVAAILGIDQQKVESAFNQAQREMQTEALASQLKSLVDQGTITQAQADQYLQWWKSKPDLPGVPGAPGLPGGHGFRGLPPGAGTAPQATPKTN